MNVKLDRVLGNAAWTQQYPEMHANFLIPGVSDHCPALIHGRDPAPRFRFFNHWTENAEYIKILHNAWQTEVQGDPLIQFSRKLKAVKSVLKNWSRDHFYGLHSRVAAAKDHLDCIASRR